MRVTAIIFHFSHVDCLNKPSCTGMACPFFVLNYRIIHFIFVVFLSLVFILVITIILNN